MITVEQIEAENLNPLSDEQVLTLGVLIKSYEGYTKQVGRWPNFTNRLAIEKANPTVKTQGLKAILKAHSALPKLVLESRGSDNRQSFLSTKENWDELAQDALNILFDEPIISNGQSFFVTQRKIVLNTGGNCNGTPFFMH